MPSNKYVLLLSIFGFCTSRTFTQGSLVLRPVLGIGSGFCYFKAGPQSDDGFNLKKYGNNSLDPFKNKQVGLLLEKAAGDRYKIQAGLTTGIAAYAYTFNAGEKNVILNGTVYPDKASDSYQRSIHLIRLPVNVKYCLKRFSERSQSKTDSVNEKKYSAGKTRSTLELVGGISLNYAYTDLNKNLYNKFTPGQVTKYSWTSNTDTIDHEAFNHYQNRWSVSVNGGIAWNIYRKSKELVSLTLYYEQGLMNMVNVDMYFSRNSKTFYRQMGTRGSQVQLNVSFPIRLSAAP